jgi:hypothetical protein
MDTAQKICTLKDVALFLGIYQSDILPPPPSVTRSATLIVNRDPHTAKGTHLSSHSFTTANLLRLLFRFIRLAPLVPNILTFLRRACSVWEYNTTQMQGLTSTVCGNYCCLFALYMHRGYSPRQFVGLFDPATADSQISRLFALEFGPMRTKRREGQVCTPSIKGNYTAFASPFSSCHSSDTHYGGCCRFCGALWNTK